MISIKISIKISKQMTELKRKLYKRGSSYETTIPMPMLFLLDKDKIQGVLISDHLSVNPPFISINI